MGFFGTHNRVMSLGRVGTHNPRLSIRDLHKPRGSGGLMIARVGLMNLETAVERT
jgi:hypothetical protein